MKVNDYYTLDEISSIGLEEKEIRDLHTTIFTKGNKVYFFELLGEKQFRLHSIISEKSFFL